MANKYNVTGEDDRNFAWRYQNSTPKVFRHVSFQDTCAILRKHVYLIKSPIFLHREKKHVKAYVNVLKRLIFFSWTLNKRR